MRSYRFARLGTLRIVTALAVLLAPLASAQAQMPRGAVNPAFLTRESAAAVSLRPRQVLTDPAAQLLPIEVAKAAGEKFIGMDPAEVISATAVVEPPLGPIPYYAVILQANREFDLAKLAPEISQHATPGKIADRDCLVSQNPVLPCFMVLQQRTLVAASQGMLEKLFDRDRPKADGVLAKRVASQTPGDDLYVAVDLVALRPLLQLGLMQAQNDAPEEARVFFQVPTLLESAELTINICAERSTRLVAHTASASAADQLEGLLDAGMQMAREKMRADMEEQLAELRGSDDPIQQAAAAYMDRISNAYTDMFRPQREGESFIVFEQEPQPSNVQNAAVMGILVALLLPAVQAAREAARRTQSMNNLKQLLIAFHFHHDAQRHFPPHAVYADDGKPQLSWRVAILPFVNQQTLYDRFHLDEPWDSEHNRTLIAEMPDIFLDPSSSLTLEQGKTHYVAPVGEGFVFTGNDQGTRIQEITDGTANTLALLQVDDAHAVVWTKPEDWQYDPEDPLRGLNGSLHPGVFLVGFADGHLDSLEESTDPQLLQKLLTASGGEEIAADF